MASNDCMPRGAAAQSLRTRSCAAARCWDAETLEMTRSVAAALLGLLALLVALAVGGGVGRFAEVARITFACVLVFGPLLAFGGLVARIAHGSCLRDE
jgi:hypothetical protein